MHYGKAKINIHIHIGSVSLVELCQGLGLEYHSLQSTIQAVTTLSLRWELLSQYTMVADKWLFLFTPIPCLT